MPASCAIAGRCSAALVEPPVAATTAAAFSKRLARHDVARPDAAAQQVHHRLRPTPRHRRRGVHRRRRSGRARQRQADRLRDAGHGVGGELPGAGAGRRQPWHSSSCSSSSLILPALCRPTPSKTSTMVTSRPWKRPGRIEPPYMKTAGHVEAQHRHHHAGQRLVAAGEADQRVVAMAAHGELDRIGDDLARDQRGLHALMAHRDAVGDGDGGEFARRAAGCRDALLGRLGLARQRDVAGRRLVPGGDDADDRLGRVCSSVTPIA